MWGEVAGLLLDQRRLKQLAEEEIARMERSSTDADKRLA